MAEPSNVNLFPEEDSRFTALDPRERTIVSMPFYAPRRFPLNAAQQRRPIPYTICTTSSVLALPWRFAERFKDLVLREPYYEAYFFDDKHCRQYIVEHQERLPAGTLAAFDNLIPGAFKSDLFRYVFAYIQGGFYVDANKKISLGLDSFIEPHLDLILARDQTSYNFPWHIENSKIFQAIMACRPGMPFMYKCIERVVYNSEHHLYGHTFLFPTGPYLMGEVLREHYGLGRFWKCGRHVWKGDQVRIFYPFNLFNRIVTDDETGEPIMHLKSGDDSLVIDTFFAKTNKVKRYSVAWSERNIYVDQSGPTHRKYQERVALTLWLLVTLLLVLSIGVWYAPEKTCCTRRVVLRGVARVLPVSVVENSGQKSLGTSDAKNSF